MAYRKIRTRDPTKTGKPGPWTLVGPQRTLEKTENRDPNGSLAEPWNNRKTGTWGPSVALAGPSYKNWKTGTRGLRKTRKPGPQWDPQKP